MKESTVATLTATPIMAKKKEPEAADTTLKIEKELYRQLSVLAAHKGTSVKGLVDPVLREFVSKERPKMIAELQEEDD